MLSSARSLLAAQRRCEIIISNSAGQLSLGIFSKTETETPVRSKFKRASNLN